MFEPPAPTGRSRLGAEARIHRQPRTPLITVFTACHEGHAKYLKQAIDSVLAQTEQRFEYLIFNDGESPAVQDVIFPYLDEDVRVWQAPRQRESTKGPHMNESIEIMRGQFWTWCPADDWWEPNLLATKLRYSIQHNHDAVLYSDYRICHPDGKITKTMRLRDRTPEQLAEAVWKGSPIGFTGIWIPKRVFQEVGGFPEDEIFSEDFKWMIKATIHGVKFRRVPELLYVKRKNPQSVTAQHLPEILERVKGIWAEMREYQERYFSSGATPKCPGSGT